MAVPKKHHTSARRDKRRSHHALKPSSPVLCAHCKQPTRSHRVCGNCGFYAGVEIQTPKE